MRACPIEDYLYPSYLPHERQQNDIICNQLCPMLHLLKCPSVFILINATIETNFEELI